MSFIVPTLVSLSFEGDGHSLGDKAGIIWDIRKKS